MTEPTPPQPAVNLEGRSERSKAARARALKRLALRTDGLIRAIDGLLHRIDAIWDESPETLAMLVDWSDALQAQKNDLEAWQRLVGHEAERVSRARQLLQGLWRDLKLVFGLGRRLRRLALHGERLRAAQAEAVERADDAAHRALFSRHLAQTERDLARLAERIGTGH